MALFMRFPEEGLIPGCIIAPTRSVMFIGFLPFCNTVFPFRSGGTARPKGVKIRAMKISPDPSFPKRGNASLWKREDRMDFQLHW
jgi:hypothetical protein